MKGKLKYKPIDTYKFLGNPKTRKPETGNRKPESGIRNRNPESEPETRNRNPESGIRNPESTNQRKQVLQVRENYLAKL